MPSDLRVIFLQAGYVELNTYAPALFFIKLSLLLFYRRVFTTNSKTTHARRMRTAIYLVGAYVTAAYLASQFSYIFICLPVSFWWNTAYAIVGLQPPTTGEYANLVPRIISLAVINIVSDLLILLLPMLGLQPIHLPLRRKVAIFFVFALGGL